MEKRSRCFVSLLFIFALILSGFVGSTGSYASLIETAKAAETPVKVQLLAITDLHGYLAKEDSHTITGPDGQRLTVGGAAYLSSHLKRLQQGVKNSIFFGTGDMFSGWPEYTQAFGNEPTIEVLNALGMQFSALGNHEFDRGYQFLRHMTDGTCFGTVGKDSCFLDSTGKRFAGADYEYDAANVVDPNTGKPIFEPYRIIQVQDGNGGTIPVGIISADAAKTPDMYMSYGGSGFTFEPIVDSINHYVKVLQSQGVHTIVANFHQGFSDHSSDYNGCYKPFGVAFEMAKKISPEVDAIFTGHWHALVNCMIPGPDGTLRPVIEGGQAGELISEVDLTIDPETKDVIPGTTKAINHLVTQDIQPDPQIEHIVDYWQSRWQEKKATQITTLTDDLSFATNRESAMGNLVADIVEEQAKAPEDGGADFAILAPSLIKGGLSFQAGDDPADADGRVLFSEAWYTLGQTPIVTVSLTGATIDCILEQQWQAKDDGTITRTALSVSQQVQYSYNSGRPVGERVDPKDVLINGKHLNPNRTYRVATDVYAIFGRRGFSGFTDYSDPVRVPGPVVIRQALLHYLRTHDPVQPPSTNRATDQSPGVLEVTTSKTKVKPGQEITVSTTLTNEGKATLTHVILTPHLPANWNVQPSGDKEGYEGNNDAGFRFYSLTPGETVTAMWTVTAPDILVRKVNLTVEASYRYLGRAESIKDHTALLPSGLVSQSQMTATASSYHTGYEPPKAIDGDPATFWHSEYTPHAPLPQAITLDLDGIYNVAALTYLPRPQSSGGNGTITRYNIYVSSDGENFIEVATGDWPYNHKLKVVTFPAHEARYVRLQAIEGRHGFASAAEINIGYKEE